MKTVEKELRSEVLDRWRSEEKRDALDLRFFDEDAEVSNSSSCG
jgi:hypothetical protein